MTLEENFREILRRLVEKGEVKPRRSDAAIPEATWYLENGIVMCKGAPTTIDLHDPENIQTLLEAYQYCMTNQLCLDCKMWRKPWDD